MHAIAASSANADSTGVILWSCVLVVILVAAFWLVLRVKRRFRDEEIDTNPTASAGFTLSDLRQMHRDGVMSDEEFEKAKAKIIEAAKRAAARDSAPPPAGPGSSQLP